MNQLLATLKIITGFLLVTSAISCGPNTSSDSAPQAGSIDMSSNLNEKTEASACAPAEPAFRPAGTISINGGVSVTNQSSVSLTLFFAEPTLMKISNTADCSCGTWEPYDSSKAWTLNSPNSMNTISVQFKDYDGIPSHCVSASVLHDSSGPIVSIMPNSQNTYLDNSVTRFDFTVVDPGIGVGSGTVMCSLDLQALPCSIGSSGTGSLELSNLNAGNHSLLVTATDSLGQPTTQTYNFTITPYVPPTTTTLPPVTTTTLPPVVTTTTLPSTTTTLPPATTTTTLPPVTTTTLPPAVTTTTMPPTTTTLPPVVTTTTMPPTTTTLPPVVTTTTTPVTPVQNISIKINNGAEFTRELQVALQLNADGAQHMYLTQTSGCASGGSWEPFAKDKGWLLAQANAKNSVYAKFKNAAGETSCINASILHDGIAPVLKIVSYPETDSSSDQGKCHKSKHCKYTKEKRHKKSSHGHGQCNKHNEIEDPNEEPSSTQIVLSIIENGSGLQGVFCKMDGGNFAPCNTTVEIAHLPDGNHIFSAYAVDRAGNVSSTQSVSFVKGKDKPEPTCPYLEPQNVTCETWFGPVKAEKWKEDDNYIYYVGFAFSGDSSSCLKVLHKKSCAFSCESRLKYADQREGSRGKSGLPFCKIDFPGCPKGLTNSGGFGHGRGDACGKGQPGWNRLGGAYPRSYHDQ